MLRSNDESLFQFRSPLIFSRDDSITSQQNESLILIIIRDTANTNGKTCYEKTGSQGEYIISLFSSGLHVLPQWVHFLRSSEERKLLCLIIIRETTPYKKICRGANNQPKMTHQRRRRTESFDTALPVANTFSQIKVRSGMQKWKTSFSKKKTVNG